MPGGTNALRTQGPGFAVWVMVIDIGKGWLAPAAVVPDLPLVGIDPPIDRALAHRRLCHGRGRVGHVYPVWYGFRGGKGAATLIGVLVGLKPVALLPVLAVWLVVVMLTGFVGLATMVAVAAFPAYVAAARHRSVARAADLRLRDGAVRVLYASLEHRAHARRHRESRAAPVAAAYALTRRLQ